MSKGNGKQDEADPNVSDLKIEDKRHWARNLEEEDGGTDEIPDTEPTVVGEYRQRAERAEIKLREYIEAFKDSQAEMELARERLGRDVDRRVELSFGGLVADLLQTVDDLDLALRHTGDVAAAAALADGVSLARDRFLAILAKHGVERIDCDGEPFDPNVAEAVQTVPVVDDDLVGRVAETLRPGYRLGGRILRAAQVAVGQKAS